MWPLHGCSVPLVPRYRTSLNCRHRLPACLSLRLLYSPSPLSLSVPFHHGTSLHITNAKIFLNSHISRNLKLNINSKSSLRSNHGKNFLCRLYPFRNVGGWGSRTKRIGIENKRQMSELLPTVKFREGWARCVSK